jgi:uncharacterized coiled-coil protein SlyX
MRKETKTKREQVFTYLIDNKVDLFTISELDRALPDIGHRTLTTMISGYFVAKGLVLKTNQRIGKSRVYKNPHYNMLEHYTGSKKLKVGNLEFDPRLESKASEDNDKPDDESEQEASNSYESIGRGIEQLLIAKNEEIKKIRSQLILRKAEKNDVEKQVMDVQKESQEKDIIISEQSKKMIELNEQLREAQKQIEELKEKIKKKKYGSIKLDELQAVVQGRA